MGTSVCMAAIYILICVKCITAYRYTNVLFIEFFFSMEFIEKVDN